MTKYREIYLNSINNFQFSIKSPRYLTISRALFYECIVLNLHHALDTHKLMIILALMI